MALRKAFAILLIVIFGLIAIPTFFVRSIATTYINPEFYDGEVLEESYEYFVDFVGNEIHDEEKVASYYSEEEIESAIRKYFPQDAIRTIVQDFIMQLKSLNDKRMDSAITVSLMPIKNNIKEMAGDFAGKIIDSIPTCNIEEELEALVYKDDLPVCIPQSIDRAEIILPIEREIEHDLNETIPSEFTLDSRSNGDAEKVHLTQIISVINYIEMILPMFMLVLLLIIMLVIYKPISTVLKFVASALLTAGMLSMVTAQLLLQLPKAVITMDEMIGYTAAEITQLQSFYTFLIEFVSSKMTIYALYFIGIGLITVLITIFMSKKHPHQDFSEPSKYTNN